MNLNELSTWLMETASFAGELPVPIQIAWVAVVGWTVLQVLWFVRVRAALAVPPLVEAPRPRPRPVRKKVDAAPAPASTGDLLQDLGVQVHGSSSPLDSAYR